MILKYHSDMSISVLTSYITWKEADKIALCLWLSQNI